MAPEPWVRPHPDGAVLRLKVVPGASRDQLAGSYGDRLRVKVAAPPEKGKANAAVLSLLARRLGLPARELTITEGETGPRKTVLVRGVDAASVAERL